MLKLFYTFNGANVPTTAYHGDNNQFHNITTSCEKGMQVYSLQSYCS